MIRMRHQQPSLWETFFAEEAADLWAPWMRAVDELLEDVSLGGQRPWLPRSALCILQSRDWLF